MKKIAILQSNYIPWKGYFDLIAAVDEFILYDDVQYTKNDWRNRNRIKTPTGIVWITIPVGQAINRRIRDVLLPQNDIWKEKHWKMLHANYRRAAHFQEVVTLLEHCYLDNKSTNLSEFNRHLIETICKYLGISTKLSYSWDYGISDGKTERLIDLCIKAGGTEYISGPAARNYIDVNLFKEKRIKLSWFNYDDYPTYPQLWGKFIHHVSVLDLLFNCGKDSPRYMRYVRK